MTCGKKKIYVLVEKYNIPFIDADYDVDNWFSWAKGMEWEPEKEYAVQCVLICVLNVRHYTLMKMDLT